MKSIQNWLWISLMMVLAIMSSCGVDMPKEKPSSFETMIVAKSAVEKHGYYHRQVEVLKDAYKGTHELMDNGKASYLEVLTAQETLLNAQLNEAVNMYNGAQGIIALYIALGGATR